MSTLSDVDEPTMKAQVAFENYMDYKMRSPRETEKNVDIIEVFKSGQMTQD